MAHLAALEAGLAHERARLAVAKSAAERTLRAVWVAQREKEIAHEVAFLAAREIEAPDDVAEMSDDELLAELGA